MSWYTRGSRPDRNIEAAALAGLFGLLDAVAKGKPRPWLQATGRALGAGLAMNEHRLRDRARAQQRNERIGDQVAEVLDQLLDMHDQSTTHAALPLPSAHAVRRTSSSRSGSP